MGEASRGEGCGGVGEERAEAGPAGFGTVVGEEGNDGGELYIRGGGGWVVEVEGGGGVSGVVVALEGEHRLPLALFKASSVFFFFQNFSYYFEFKGPQIHQCLGQLSRITINF